jgi:colicin import membrane protein
MKHEQAKRHAVKTPAVAPRAAAEPRSDWEPLANYSDEQWKAFWLALGIHVLLAGLLYVGFEQGQPIIQAPAGEPIEAFIADLPKTRAPGKSPTAAVRPPPPQVNRPMPAPVDNVTDQRPVLPEPRPIDPLAIAQAEQEEQRKREEARRQDELNKLIEQRVQAEEETRKKQEQLDQLRADQQRLEEEARLAAIGEEDTALRGAREDNSLMAQYQSLMISRIEEAWLRPLDAKPGIRCRLHVVQIPGGEVISVAVAGVCNVDESIKRTILEAPMLASPLPYEGFQSVFQRDLYLNFEYDG